MPFMKLTNLSTSKNYSFAMGLFSNIREQLIYLSRRLIGKGYYQLSRNEKKILANYIINYPTEDLTIKPTCYFLHMALSHILSQTIDQFLEKISEEECVDLMDEITVTSDDYDGVTEEILCKAQTTIGFRE